MSEFSAYYSNRISYKETEKLIERMTGSRQLSDQKIREIVLDKASEVSKIMEQKALAIEKEGLGMPKINTDIDIYDQSMKEALLFDDAIQVKKQKDVRVKQETAVKMDKQETVVNSKVLTDVMMLEQKD